MRSYARIALVVVLAVAVLLSLGVGGVALAQTATPEPTSTPVPQGVSGQQMATYVGWWSGLDYVWALGFGLFIVLSLVVMVDVLSRR